MKLRDEDGYERGHRDLLVGRSTSLRNNGSETRRSEEQE